MRLLKITFIVLLFLGFGSYKLNSQTQFIKSICGEWEGTIFIYNKNHVDSVNAKLTIAETDTVNCWTWRTEYSDYRNTLKDYRIVYESDNKFFIDEGDGIKLSTYLYDNKLYSFFEAEQFKITATYEHTTDDKLIFEIIIANNPTELVDEITDYQTNGIQKVIFSRIKEE